MEYASSKNRMNASVLIPHSGARGGDLAEHLQGTLKRIPLSRVAI